MPLQPKKAAAQRLCSYLYYRLYQQDTTRPPGCQCPAAIFPPRTLGPRFAYDALALQNRPLSGCKSSQMLGWDGIYAKLNSVRPPGAAQNANSN